ncbi:hypothetical protein DL96DRAFT_1553464 [Flagelloscypha sp. PMI_526]|nr:hypothetical protein DL96DRAFT_1553464 [Flagelloscypha sp. PMI_526]
MITFYDIPSTLPGTIWSPHTTLIRLALEFKGIPYETKWVEFPDIKAVSEKIGASSTGTWPNDGSPYYTLPIIQDSKTGKVLSDSWNIVVYIDETYPESPRLIPRGSKAFMKVFIDIANEKLMATFGAFNIAKTTEGLMQVSQIFYRETRPLLFGGATVEMVGSMASWDDVKKTLDWVDELIKLNEGDGLRGGYILGEELTYADIFVGTKIYWSVVHGKESQVWKDLCALHGGRWGKLIAELERVGKLDQVQKP